LISAHSPLDSLTRKNQETAIWLLPREIKKIYEFTPIEIGTV